MKVRVPISGRPSPKVEWHRGDGGMVQESERVSFEQDEHSVTMCVKDCCREDAGTYEVKIHNSMASDQASFKVTITGFHLKVFFVLIFYSSNLKTILFSKMYVYI